MRQLLVSLLLFSTTAMATVVVDGISEFPLSGALEESDKALGYEFAKQDALNKLRLKLALGLAHNSVYVVSPAIKSVTIKRQVIQACEESKCLKTELEVTADENVLDAIKSQLDTALTSMTTSDLSLDDVSWSLNTRLSLLQQRYRLLVDSTDLTQAKYAQWMRLIADEKLYALRLQNAATIQKPTLALNELTGIGWRKASVSLMDDADYVLKEFHSTHGDLSLADIWQHGISDDPFHNAASEEFLSKFVRDVEINITRFYLPNNTSSKPLVVKALYDCLTYQSPDDYLDDVSVRQFVLFNNDVEIMIGGLAIGRGYVTQHESNLDKRLDNDPVPRLCYLQRAELFIPKSLAFLDLEPKLGITIRNADGTYIGRTVLNRYKSNSRYEEALDTEELSMWELFEPSQQVLQFLRLKEWFKASHQRMREGSACLGASSKESAGSDSRYFTAPEELNIAHCQALAVMPRVSDELGLGTLHNALLHHISRQPNVRYQPVKSDHTEILKPYAYPQSAVRVNEYQANLERLGYLDGTTTTYWLGAKLNEGR